MLVELSGKVAAEIFIIKVSKFAIIKTEINEFYRFLIYDFKYLISNMKLSSSKSGNSSKEQTPSSNGQAKLTASKTVSMEAPLKKNANRRFTNAIE